MTKCIIKKCFKPVASCGRGLCAVCYGEAKRIVESGATTWSKLEQMGLAMPNTGADVFTEAYNQAKEDTNASNQ